MAKKVLLVVNPISGNKDKTSLINKLKSSLSKSDSLKIYKTKGEDDQKNIKSVYEHFQPNRIIAAGGDGTIKTIGEALVEDDYSLGILPAGSSNGLATDLELPLSDMDAAIKVALGDKTKAIDCLSIDKNLCLHISDLGINAALIEKYANSLIRGQFGYILNSIPTLIETEHPYHFTIKANEKTTSTTAVMIAFANSRKFGTGAMVNPDGEIDDGFFEVLIFKSLNIIEILKTLQREVQLSSDFVEVIRTDKAIVSSKEAVCFQIDGEFHGKVSEVQVSILPKNIKVATST